MTVAPLDIEDTSDWLGCPTEPEACRHYLSKLENEMQELTLQLRQARGGSKYEDLFRSDRFPRTTRQASRSLIGGAAQ
jgi:hypothetical protein